MLETMEASKGASRGKRAQRLSDIREVFELAASPIADIPEELEDVVDAIRDGEYVVFERHDTKERAYSSAAQVRDLVSKQEDAECWTVLSRKEDDDSGVVLVRHDVTLTKDSLGEG